MNMRPTGRCGELESPPLRQETADAKLVVGAGTLAKLGLNALEQRATGQV